jgi:hypothetical protein
MTQRELPSEIVKAIEIAINRCLDRSIVYSPFRLFYNLFKKSNPKLMEHTRKLVARDILEYLNTIDNFTPEIFISENTIHPIGKILLQYCYNIGVVLMKKKLTVILAFKVLRNAALRDETYSYVLNEVRKATIMVMSQHLINKAPDSEPETVTDDNNVNLE